jgi:uncharacterized membrane-anchored protein
MKLLIAIVAAQVTILVGMIALDGLPYLLGQRIKLKVVPVDPRDFFRGDYVVLSYDFSRFDPASFHGMSASPQLNPSDRAWAGREVFVALRPVGDHYEAGVRSTKPPLIGPYLCGRVTGGWPNRIEYGIEAYYVQEGEGRRLEQLIRQRQLMAEVAVWHGKAKLVRLVE